MDELTTQYINMFGSFLFLVVGLLFLYQTKSKHRNTPVLTTGFFVAFVGQFLNSLLIIQRMTNRGFFVSLDPLNAFILQIIFITAINAILAFFWIFLEHSNAIRINANFLLLFVIFAVLYIWTFAFGIITLQIAPALAIGNLSFSVLLNIVIIRSVYILFKVYIATGREKIALSQLISFLLIQLWGINALISGVQAYMISFYSWTAFYPDLQSIFDIFYYFGLVIFILTILINPDYIYRLPLNIQDIIILTSYGTAVYGIGRNADEKSLDEQLLAGFITAANAFIREMQPQFENELISNIKSNGRLIRMEFGKTIGVCLVSQKENLYLLRSIKNLVKHIEMQNPSEIIDRGMFFKDEEVRSWLKQFFPYLGIEEMQTY